MNCRIDEHIVRLLQLTGYSTYQALKDLVEEDFNFIATFVKDGSILDHINPEDLHVYLGTCKSREKFSFLPGEKKLILSIASYVKKNHSETDKRLGKLPLYPMFNKTSRKASCDLSNVPKKLKASDLVVSLDIPKEIACLRKLLKEFCLKKSFPKVISDAMLSLKIEVKTVETDKEAYLSGFITCPVCKKGRSVQKYQTAWNTSNMAKHLKSHVANKDYNLGSLDSFAAKASGTPDLETTKSDDEDSPEEITNAEKQGEQTVGDSSDQSAPDANSGIDMIDLETEEASNIKETNARIADESEQDFLEGGDTDKVLSPQ